MALRAVGRSAAEKRRYYTASEFDLPPARVDFEGAFS